MEPTALHATLFLVKIEKLRKVISTNDGDDTNAGRWDDITSKYVPGGDIVKYQNELIDADMCAAAELQLEGANARVDFSRPLTRELA